VTNWVIIIWIIVIITITIITIIVIIIFADTCTMNMPGFVPLRPVVDWHCAAEADSTTATAPTVRVGCYETVGVRRGAAPA